MYIILFITYIYIYYIVYYIILVYYLSLLFTHLMKGLGRTGWKNQHYLGNRL